MYIEANQKPSIRISGYIHFSFHWWSEVLMGQWALCMGAGQQETPLSSRQDGWWLALVRICQAFRSDLPQGDKCESGCVYSLSHGWSLGKKGLGDGFIQRRRRGRQGNLNGGCMTVAVMVAYTGPNYTVTHSPLVCFLHGSVSEKCLLIQWNTPERK